MGNNWWNAGGANPVWGVTSGWQMTGIQMTVNDVRVCLSFADTLTIEQMNIATQLIQEGKAIEGRYNDWQHFAQVHGLTGGSTLTGGSSPVEGDADNQSSAVMPAGR